MPIRIKICGITRWEDAHNAVDLGVNALGFIFSEDSPRYIKPMDAADIIRRLPPFISKVGVFVNMHPSRIMDVARISGIDTVQLHGNEPPEAVYGLSLCTIKAFGVNTDFDLGILDTYDVNGFLLDTWDAGKPGGTGRTFDWSIARRAAEKHNNIILAGGLNAVNIRDALDNVQPYSIDLNSGVEVSPGIKNPQKMREAVEIVRMWKPSTQRLL
jgi:phosphoribosylanthranilate isomerase